ncbi:hypothetical protein DACRYDRAFT_18685 [Dacryopinax primogenitus]|uniref:Uncharacterized protein n=1 Tax=Dacryopinax primogenitus (strain DJM 731) TaxID=1858805 RepID=M5FND7_DACPD|nr:uncharacterized protein DACRYDRAFT_18685 [Dacryopinax primogenitus]EJT97265.1 hypothetical protein DACRYDRAFT_18685 [Dacryopinax primogenitus]
MTKTMTPKQNQSTNSKTPGGKAKNKEQEVPMSPSSAEDHVPTMKDTQCRRDVGSIMLNSDGSHRYKTVGARPLIHVKGAEWAWELNHWELCEKMANRHKPMVLFECQLDEGSKDSQGMGDEGKGIETGRFYYILQEMEIHSATYNEIAKLPEISKEMLRCAWNTCKIAKPGEESGNSPAPHELMVEIVGHFEEDNGTEESVDFSEVTNILSTDILELEFFVGSIFSTPMFFDAVLASVHNHMYPYSGTLREWDAPRNTELVTLFFFLDVDAEKVVHWIELHAQASTFIFDRVSVPGGPNHRTVPVTLKENASPSWSQTGVLGFQEPLAPGALERAVQAQLQKVKDE